MPPLFERVTIAGVGLIGGSLALAARAAGLITEVVGYGRTEANLRIARERGIIERYSFDPLVAARDADLLLVCVPVRAIAAVARACAPALKPGAVVSDVGSVKASVLRELEACVPAGISVVGGHPIAGTEHTGAAAAFAELFQGQRCIITPGAHAAVAAVDKVRALWEGVGMQVDVLDAEQHDAILAWVSHLPHALAFSAVTALLDADGTCAPFAGPSFRDLTRVAASSVEMWTDIFLANAAPVDAVVSRFITALEELRQAIARGDAEKIRHELTRAQAARRRWNEQASGHD